MSIYVIYTHTQAHILDTSCIFSVGSDSQVNNFDYSAINVAVGRQRYKNRFTDIYIRNEQNYILKYRLTTSTIFSIPGNDLKYVRFIRIQENKSISSAVCGLLFCSTAMSNEDTRNGFLKQI